MKHCPQCQLAAPDSFTFCKQCGGQLIDDETTLVHGGQLCPSCGATAKPGWRYCQKCSSELHRNADSHLELTQQLSSTPPGHLQQNANAWGVSTAPACSDCGTRYSKGMEFCGKCGKQLPPLELDAPTLPVTNGLPPAMRFQGNVAPGAPVPGAFAVPLAMPAESNPVICHKCGAWVPDGRNFCESCGTPVSFQGTGALPVKRRRPMIIAAVVGSVLIVGLLLFWYLWGVKLVVISQPPGARVYVDGAEIAQTNINNGRLEIPHLGRGTHTLRVSHEGFTELSQNFDLGMTHLSQSIDVKLDPAVFTLTIVTDPHGSQVMLDAQEKGSTDSTEGRLVLPGIARGPHTLALKRDGYQDWSQNISLESAQLIRATLTPNYEEPPPPPTETSGDSASAQSDVQSTLAGWARSLSSRNLDNNMSYYAEHLDTFLSMSDVSSEQVRATRMKLFGKYSSINIQLSNVQPSVDSSGTSAIVTLDINYDFRGGKSLTGKAQNEIWLEKRGARWLITNEKHLQTYYENNE